MRTKGFLTFVLMTIVMIEAHAISGPKFQKEASKNVWSMRNELFDPTVEIPDSVRNGESAVVIADYYRVFTNYENIRDLHRETTRLRRTRWNRRMVKLFDNKAIEEFSEHEFGNRVRLDVENYTFGGSDNAFGARIHKPDGRVVDVDLSEAFAVSEGKKGKDVVSNKVAIPGLEPGDVLEYFDYNEEWIDEFDLPSVDIVPFDDYSVMRLVIDAEFSPKVTAEFRCYNDFIKPKLGVTAKGNNTLTFDMSNIGTLTDKKFIRKMRQLPFLKIATLNNASPYRFYPSTVRRGGLHGNVAPGTIYRDIKYAIAASKYKEDFVKKVKRIFEDYRKAHPDADSRELADACWLAGVYVNAVDSKGQYGDYGFSIMMAELMNKLKISESEAKIAFVNSRSSVPTRQIMSWRQPDYGVLLDKVLYLPEGYEQNAPGEVLADYQGEEGAHFPGDRKALTDQMIPVVFTVPVSKSHNNKMTVSGTVDVNVDDSKATADLTLKAIGTVKEFPGLIVDLATWAPHAEEYLGIPQKQRYTEKNVDEVARKEKRDEAYKKFFKMIVSPDAKVDTAIVVQPGSIPSAAETIVTTKVTVEDCIVDAGNDVMLQVGKLFSDNQRIDGKERERQLDIYTGSPHQVAYDITFNIPEGYTVDEASLETLKKMENNTYGSFYSEGRLTEDGNLEIHVRERYNTYIIPLEDWGSMLQILDASASFSDASIVLKKK